MKAIRFLMALLLALALHTAPVSAGQGTIVGPTAGPKTMAEVMGTINAAFLAIQSCNSGSTAPANGVGSLPTQYQCWADTSASPEVAYKYYDGTSWVTFGTLNTSTHVWTPYRAGAPIVAVATSGSASDLSTGTLPAARLPNPSASTLGGVQSKTCSASQWLNDVSTGGVLSCAQPNFTDLAGTASLAQLPAFSGMTVAAAASDTDSFPTNQGAGNLKQTLAAVKTWIKAWIVKADVGLGNVDNTSDATKNAATATLTNKTLTSPVINSPTGIVKGDVGLGNVDNTSDATKWGATKTLTNTTYNCGSTGNVCTVRFADITGFGTGVSTALGVNVGSAGAVVVNGGALGTPSSGVATNLTGTAAGLTAGNVTTNANLTGDVTSVGNATTLTNAPVIAKVLTAFSAAAGTVSSSDSILTAFQKVVGNLALKADIASPALTGMPTAPTQAANDNSTKIATTAYADTLGALKANTANGTHTGVLDIQGARKDSTQSTPPQIAANTNDYNPSSVVCATTTTIIVNADAARDLTGLAGGVAGCDIFLFNNGSFPITLKDGSLSSTAANRFDFGADFSLASKAAAHLKYDGNGSRWRNLTGSGSGGGGGGVSSVTVAAGTGISVSGTCTITTSGTCTVGLSTPVSPANGGTGVASPAAGTIPVNQGASPQTGIAMGAGQGLGANSSGTPAATDGAWRLLNTLTANNTTASLDDTTTFSTWGNIYNDFQIVVNNLIPATNAACISLQVRSGGTFQTSSYLSSVILGTGAAASSGSLTTGHSIGSCGNNILNTAASGGVSGRGVLSGPINGTTSPKFWNGEFTHEAANAPGVWLVIKVGSSWRNTAALDGIRVIASTGNLLSGVVKVYGRK